MSLRARDAGRSGWVPGVYQGRLFDWQLFCLSNIRTERADDNDDLSAISATAQLSQFTAAPESNGKYILCHHDKRNVLASVLHDIL